MDNDILETKSSSINDIINHYINKGDYFRAIEIYEKNEEKPRKDTNNENNMGKKHPRSIGNENTENDGNKYRESLNKDIIYKIATLYDRNLEKKEKAFECYKKAAHRGSVEALNELGSISLSNNKNEEAFKYFKKAAEKGYSIAEYNLAYCYKVGNGTEKDEKKAFECYEKAVKGGYEEAEYELGCCYENGIGVEKNEIKAYEHFSRALKHDQEIPAEKIKSIIKGWISILENKEDNLKTTENVINQNKIQNNEKILGTKEREFRENCKNGNFRIANEVLKKNKDKLIENLNLRMDNGTNFLYNLFDKDKLNEEEKKLARLLIENGLVISNGGKSVPRTIINNLKETIGEKYFTGGKITNEILYNYRKDKLDEQNQLKNY